MQQSKRTLFLMATGLLLIIAFLAIGYRNAIPATDADQKTIAIQVIVADEPIVSRNIDTREEYLAYALLKEDLIAGSYSQLGLFITTVNGITADDGKQQWWCITKGGEQVMSSADTTPIQDGDQFELTLMEGY